MGFKIFVALLFRLPFYVLAGLAFKELGTDIALVYATLAANAFGTYLQMEVQHDLAVAKTRGTSTETNAE